MMHQHTEANNNFP